MNDRHVDQLWVEEQRRLYLERADGPLGQLDGQLRRAKVTIRAVDPGGCAPAVMVVDYDNTEQGKSE